LLRTHQYKYNGNEIGTMIEKNKIANQSVALKKIINRNDYLNEGISILDNLANSLNSDMDYLSVMGIEGNAAKVYFPRMFDNVS
jgi:CRISPR associated protein cas1